MNPVLLKPTGERLAQVVRPRAGPSGRTDAAGVAARRSTSPSTRSPSLRARFDVVVAEGAGSCAELNLLDRDIVNLPLAAAAGLPAVLVADIDRGGVYASVAGTLRGAAARAAGAACRASSSTSSAATRRSSTGRCSSAAGGLPVLGVLPLARRAPARRGGRPRPRRLASAPAGAVLDVAVVALAPRSPTPPTSSRCCAEPRSWPCGRSRRPRSSVAPTSSCCRARRPPSPTSPGCGRPASPPRSTRSTPAPTVLGICGGLPDARRWIDDDGVESGTGPTRSRASAGSTSPPTSSRASCVRRPRRTAPTRSATAGSTPRATWYESADGRRVGHARTRRPRRRRPPGRRCWAGWRPAAGVAWEPSGLRWAEHRRAHHDRLADWLEAAVDVGSLVEVPAPLVAR